MNNTTYKMELTADNSVTLHIFDYVGTGGVEFSQVIQDLAPYVGRDLNVLINSGGGSIFDGLAIYNFIKANFPNIRTEILGWGASIASTIFLAGTQRVMREGTMLVIHKPWTMTMGNATDLQKQIETLNTLEEQLLDIYQANSNLAREQLKAMLEAETWFNSQDSLANGLATSIDSSNKKMAASVSDEYLNKYPQLKTLIEEMVESTPTNSIVQTNPSEPREKEEILMEVNSIVSGNTEVNIQNSVEVVKPVLNAQQFNSFRDYFNTLGNTNFTPKEIQEILDVVAEQNPLRKYASVYTIAGDGVVPVPGLATATYGADGATITPADPTISPITLTGWNLQGGFNVTDALMDDNFYNVAKMISQVIGGTLSDGETAVMLSTADGSAGPQGIFSKTADATTATSGVLVAQEFLDFEASLETKYRIGNEVMIMHPTTLAKIAGLADTSKKIELDRTGKTINGVPYVTSSKCPAFAANTSVIAFGDFKRGYAIANRGRGVAVKRVPSATAFAETVLFAIKNDAKIVDSSAFKVLKIKA